MFNIETLMVLVPGLPLLAALVTAALGKKYLRERSHVPALVGTVGAFVLSLLLLGKVHEMQPTHAAAAKPRGAVGSEKIHSLWTWAAIDHASTSRPTAARLGDPAPAGGSRLRIDVVLRADALTAIMLAMVTFVSSLVVVYSIGYMHGDEGYWRFFTYVSLFVFSMTMLVSVSNFLLLYVFWEAVGVCSYFLIGFWFHKPEAAAAGKKAFLVNRVGDFAFALGLFLIWTTYGTLNFHDVDAAGEIAASAGTDGTPGVLGQTMLRDPSRYVTGGLGLAIGLCLLAGACGKSAQFPLHVWLPDAMEGPTPVSALIHAATMVTAGVYLVARCTPLFVASPDATTIVAIVGCLTALMAGIIALTQTDLKRVLAYSTVSQLGYMFLAMGTGSLAGIVAGMFHLFTHAFFKALLFLGAGSVMHAMGGVIDMRRFGGLRQVLPKTHATFWFGCLALAGIVPFAGFWSKDAIISAIHSRIGDEGPVLTQLCPTLFTHAGDLYVILYYVALFTAFLTAFYTFRALFMTFYGPKQIPTEAGDHAHESPSVMTWPLVILAACAVSIGAWFHFTHGFEEFLIQTPSLAYDAIRPLRGTGAGEEFHLDIAAISTLIALAGMGLAAFLYLGGTSEVSFLSQVLEGMRRIRPGSSMANGILRGVLWPMRTAYALSKNKFYFDEIYRVLVVWPLATLGALAYWFDRNIVDALVDAIGQIPPRVGALFRVLQTGLVQFYALAMALGLLVLIGTLLAW